ncbi:MAG: S-layer homology domain-containing protein [Clostridiales bacterium]|nr:S-layer homology domain-containing protein [Clostridiales bacterium]
MLKKGLAGLLLLVMVVVMAPVDAVAFGSGLDPVSAGYAHSLAIKSDDSLWTWGGNFSGQLGDGKDRNAPAKIMDGVTAVSAGYYHSMAIKTDGSLWVWGGNSTGQIGDGTTIQRNTPKKIMDNVAAVSAGYNHSLAIKTDGSLWAWGGNLSGQLGDGSRTQRLEPVKIMDGVIAIAAGNTHSMAIRTDGSLWLWGANKNGQIGDGSTTDRPMPVMVMENVASISAGDYYYSLAVTDDGSLWAWGANDSGQLGDGSATQRNTPKKIMDSVVAASAGEDHTVAIKNDGSLWSWGRNAYGKLGDGQAADRYTPEKIMDNVAAATAGYNHTLATKKDGSLWAFGSNSWGQIGGSAIGSDVYTPVKIMNEVKKPAPAAEPTTYLAPDQILLPLDKLATVTDRSSAVSATKAAASDLSIGGKANATGIDMLTLYAEEAVALASSQDTSGDILIDKDSISALQATAEVVKTATGEALVSSGITPHRELSSGVNFKTKDGSLLKITIDSSAGDQVSGNVRVQAPDYALTFSAESIKTNTEDGLPLIITVKESSSPSLFAFSDPELTLAFLAGAQNSKTYNITFSKPIEENIKISLQPAPGDPTYQAVMGPSGNAVGGKYNPVTQTLDVRINESGNYTVKENKKDFTDIANKSPEMQNAIRILASKGIISGTSAYRFSPDSYINRAEIAALIVRTLSKYDDNAICDFEDVKPSDWFYAAVASAVKYGIVNGFNKKTFAPRMNILKDQLVAIAARVLQKEMKYKTPSNLNTVLSTYTDAGSLADWSREEIALATRENLVVKRSDGKFNPKTTITRGDAAIILYRMFNKIW